MAAPQENRTLIACTIMGLKPTARDHPSYEEPFLEVKITRMHLKVEGRDL